MQRTTQACDICRRQKSRCGGQRPQCQRCKEKSLTCSYSSHPRPRGPEKGSSSQITQRLTELEDLLCRALNEPGKPSSPAGRSTNKGIVECNAPTIETNAETARHAVEAYPAPTSHITTGQSSALAGAKAPSVSELSPAIPLLAVQSYAYYSPPPTIDTWNRTYPEAEIVLHSIDKYFCYLHGQQYLLLHRKSLLQAYLDASAAPELIYSVCAVSARFSDHEEIGTDPLYEAGEVYAEEALRIIFSQLNKPTLAMIQSLLLLCLHNAGASNFAKSWALGAMAFRLCYSLRLHSDPTPQNNHGWHDLEMRRRTLWTAFLIERFSSAWSPAPWVLGTNNINTALPTREREFLLYQDLDSLQNLDSGTIPVSNLGAYAHLVQLAEIWSRVIRFISNPRTLPDHTTPEYTTLKAELQSWYSNLPVQHHFSAENLSRAVMDGEGGVFAFLHMLFHTASCQIEQIPLIVLRGSTTAESLAEAEFVATNNAVLCVEIYTKTASMYSSLLITPMTGYFLLVSGVILARQSCCASSQESEAISKSYAHAVKGLQRIQRQWKPVARYHETLLTYKSTCERLIASTKDNISNLGNFYDRDNEEDGAIADKIVSTIPIGFQEDISDNRSSILQSMPAELSTITTGEPPKPLSATYDIQPVIWPMTDFDIAFDDFDLV